MLWRSTAIENVNKFWEANSALVAWSTDSQTFTIFYILLPTQFNSLGQFKTTSKMWITSWFIVHSQCPASCVEAKMRAPRPSAVARIIGHWRAAPAFSSTSEVKTINKSRSIDAQLMESQFLGSNLSSLASLRWIFEPTESRCDRCINNAVHTKIVGRTWLCVACAPMSRAGGWKATTHFIR